MFLMPSSSPVAASCLVLLMLSMAAVPGESPPARTSLFSDVAVAANGDVYVADPGAGRIVCVAERWGPPRTVARFDGSGPLIWPGRIAVGPEGTLFVADTRTHRVARVDVESGAVEVLAGIGRPGLDEAGRASDAALSHPAGLAWDGGRRLAVADLGNRAVRVIDLETGSIATVRGGALSTSTSRVDGVFDIGERMLPTDVAFDAAGEVLVLDLYRRAVLRVVDDRLMPVLGSTNIADTGNAAVDARIAGRRDFALAPDGTLFFAEGPAGRITRLAPGDDATRTLDVRRLQWPAAVAVDAAGGIVVADARRATLTRVDADGGAGDLLYRSEIPPPEVDAQALVVIRADPDPDVVRDAAVRAAIAACDRPWHVRHAASGVEFVLVPPGRYERGARSEADDVLDNARPLHAVRITRPLYVSRTEVTNAQYRTLDPGHVSLLSYHHDLNAVLAELSFDADDQPATNLSWYDAEDFARRWGLRLPTEGEWEYMARAGVETRFPWGDVEADGLGWANLAGPMLNEVLAFEVHPFPFEDGFVVTAPVGSLRPNGFGLHDVTGNVWEWCADWYDADEYERCVDGVDDPRGPDAGTRRVLRGSSWQVPFRGSALLSYRASVRPDVHHVLSRGVRVVLDP